MNIVLSVLVGYGENQPQITTKHMCVFGGGGGGGVSGPGKT